MKIIRHDPFSMLTPYPRWTSLLDDEWMDEGNDLTVYETDSSLVIKANVAGVPADKVEISVESGVVTIKGAYEESDEEKKNKKVIYREARISRYLYTTSIPCPVNADKVKAEIENGVVTITFPKTEAAVSKRISVTAKGK